MQERIKVIQNFDNKEEVTVKAQLKIPNNWWNSHSTIGIDEKESKLDLIRLQSERIDNTELLSTTDWDINNGDYEIDLPVNHVHIKTSWEEKVIKERYLLGAGIAAVVIIVLLFSFIVSLV